MSQLTELKEAIRKALPDLDLVLGWREGYDALHAPPYHIRRQEDLEHLVFGPMCVNNLASQLMHLRGKKVGIIVKGCDARSVVELLQEKIVNRESLVIFAMPCKGVLDVKKIRRALDIDHAREVHFHNGTIEITSGDKTSSVELKDVLADKCLRCHYPNATEYDHFIGEPVEPRVSAEEAAADPAMEELAGMDLTERFAFWKTHMNRCLRCYACRNSCPLCFCRDVCLADSRDPHWQSQETSVREKWMFQMIHAMHLAGRCTQCGECERACPVGIPILLLKKHLNAVVKDLFNYEAGIDPTATPPLFTFKVEEENIKEIEL